MYSANLIGKQMDTEFGLYLPEYSIPAPEVQTNYKEIPFRDGAIDKTSPDGVVHYKDREWDLTFKKTGATVSASDLATLAMSVMNAIHGKAGEIIFDDDPNYKWVGRVFVTSVDCENNGLLIVNIHMITHPYKYSLADIVVVDEIQTTSDEYEGSIVSFTGGIGKSIIDLLVSLFPIQNLHGYDSPWPGGGGKNKWNPTTGGTAEGTYNGITYTKNNDGSYSFSGTATGSTWINFGNITLSAGTWTASVTKTGSYTGAVTFGANNGAFVRYPNLTTYPRTVTSESETTGNFGVNFANGVAISGTLTLWIQIESGSSATSWTPYSNICPITGRTGVNVYRTGINLFNKTTVIHGYKILGTGQVYPDSNIAYTDYIPVRQGMILYCSPNWQAGLNVIFFYDSDKQMIGKEANNTHVYTTPDNCCYIRLNMLETEVDSAFVNYPSAATSYEPYNGNTYAVDWTTQAGTVYGGTVDVFTGVLTVDRAMVDLGTLNYTYDSSGRFYTSINGKKNEASDNDMMLAISSMYMPMTATAFQNTPTDGTMRGATTGGYVYFRNSAYTDAATFKTAMSGVQLVYELATPLTYQLTAQEVAALVGTNNVWSTGDSVSVTLSTMDKVTLVNHGKPMNPKINVVSEGSISLLFEIDGTRYTAALSAGEYTLPDLVLFDGSTDVYEAGEGTITYTYPEVSL